jgi:hypothetical protein
MISRSTTVHKVFVFNSGQPLSDNSEGPAGGAEHRGRCPRLRRTLLNARDRAETAPSSSWHLGTNGRQQHDQWHVDHDRNHPGH